MKYKQRLGVSVLAMTALMYTGIVAADGFVAAFGGYAFGTTDFSTIDSITEEESTVKIAESEHWGIMAGVTTPDPGSIYLLYSHQSTEFSIGDNLNQPEVTKLEIDYLHLGGALYFPQGKFRPYITTSAGLTQMRPDNGFSNETSFSMGIGGGAEYQFTPNFALFADMRGYATFINSSQALFCNSGNCKWLVDSELMWQGQVNVGTKLTF
ncbi:outer membrane beta-barrel protein [Moritella sp. Urea-trap-13]|uniref:outer membrane beta-barrel protein n=1 Tax=Moritella sp. Urea-trap-13 TaxID=2058327 RepID=UPI000C32A700|nr:outer membrane beta-barrel protein [Moritella sp. Urea-trap-13]PKH07760.1 porin family protein [Moritella sp. Urea-trap-13]